jgi:hypothetical protein
MANQSKTGNSVQLLSNELYLPFGHGDAHIHDTVLRVFDCFPKKEFPRQDPLDGMLDLIPPYSTVFYVSPVLNQGQTDEWKNLLLLTEKHVAVQCYFIDSASFIVGQIHGDYKFAEGIASDETRRNLNSAVDLFNRNGADVFVIRMQDSFTHALAKKVRPTEIRP